MNKIRVMVVDDTAVMRRLVSEVIARDPEMEVAGVASNGKIALQKMPQINPDAITLDLEMPEMGGIETVRELRKVYPKVPVIILSALTVKGAEATFEALAAGANDYVTKPSNSLGMVGTIQQLSEALNPLLKQYFRKSSVSQLPKKSETSQLIASGAPARKRKEPIEIVAIATSTGGPNALAAVFEDLRQPIPVPIVIVQHMPPLFTKTLAERLNRISGMTVHEGEEGQELLAGHAYLAPGGKHMEVVRRGSKVVLSMNENPPENSCRPAADVLFRSVAKCFGARILGVVMTGMGKDGFLGSQLISEKGGVIFAQDEASSVVWGMPSFIAKSGFAEKILPLNQISAAIAQKVRTTIGKL